MNFRNLTRATLVVAGLALALFAGVMVVSVWGANFAVQKALFEVLPPAAFLAVPMYKTMGVYGLLNTQWALILAMMAGGATQIATNLAFGSGLRAPAAPGSGRARGGNGEDSGETCPPVRRWRHHPPARRDRTGGAGPAIRPTPPAAPAASPGRRTPPS